MPEHRFTQVVVLDCPQGHTLGRYRGDRVSRWLAPVHREGEPARAAYTPDRLANTWVCLACQRSGRRRYLGTVAVEHLDALVQLMKRHGPGHVRAIASKNGVRRVGRAILARNRDSEQGQDATESRNQDP